MLLFSTMMLSSIFLFLSHPLSFGLILLMQTISISLITGKMNTNFWFSYILFLIMVGGMLILFMYMTSIASNEKFKLSQHLTIYIMLSILLLPMTEIYKKVQLPLNLKFTEIVQLPMLEKINLMKFFNTPHITTYTLMIIYLLITLIMVVKITDIKYGPLRQKF
nr:NADH dehydrogenase subunit 6 [Clytomelegena kabakovi]